jgi:hypothetical protein
VEIRYVGNPLELTVSDSAFRRFVTGNVLGTWRDTGHRCLFVLPSKVLPTRCGPDRFSRRSKLVLGLLTAPSVGSLAGNSGQCPKSSQ